MASSKEFVTRRIGKNIIFPIALFLFLTIGNYSFFRYSFSGKEYTSLLLQSISNIRLIIPLWIVSYCLWFNFSMTIKIIKEHIDILFLGLSWLISCLLSMDAISYLLYGLWSFFSLISILLFVCYSAVISSTSKIFLYRIIHTLWIGNFIILMLDIISILTTKPYNGMYQIIFSSNTFWAYPTLIIGILSLVKIRLTTDQLLKKLYYLCILAISLFAIYFSARRSPLFSLILSTILYFIPSRLPNLLLALCILIMSYTLVNSPTGDRLTESLPDSYMKYRLQRMLGMVKGQQETSYTERQKIWKMYLERFYKKPVMGEGLASMQRIMATKESKKKDFSAHNTFIGLLAETGLLGSLLMLIVVSRSIFQTLRLANNAWLRIYILLFIPTILINWVEYNLIPGQIFFLYTMIIWILPRGLHYVKNNFKTP